MSKIGTKIIATIFTAIFVFIPLLSLADPIIDHTYDPSGANAPCVAMYYAKRAVNYAFIILAPAAVLIIIVSGIILMFGGANESAHRMGRDALVGGIIGFIIVLLAWIIITTITGAMGFTKLSESWWQPPVCK